VNSKPYLNLKSNSKAQNLFCPENHFGLAVTDPFPFPFLQHRPASVLAQLGLYGLAQPNPNFVSFLCAAAAARFFTTVMARAAVHYPVHREVKELKHRRILSSSPI
jgi:hypothetical protein